MGVSMQTARDNLRKGMFKAASPGRYPLVESMNAYTLALRSRASGRIEDAARGRCRRAQAALATAKAGVLTGKLVDVSEMQADHVSMSTRKLRGLILAIPTRVGN